MRRFLLWSVLAAVVGVALAVASYWVVWTLLTPHVTSSPAPAATVVAPVAEVVATSDLVTVRNPDEVQRLLDETSWLSAGDGQGEPVWIVGDHAALSAAAVPIEALERRSALRIIPFAPADENGVARASGPERATVAELWLSRDWLLYQRWLATAPDAWTGAGIPPAEQDTARFELVETGRRFAQRLSGLMGVSGLTSAYPVVIWRDADGTMKACACAELEDWSAISTGGGVVAEATPIPERTVAVPKPTGPTYPRLRAASPSDAVAAVEREEPTQRPRRSTREATPVPERVRPITRPPATPRAEPTRKASRPSEGGSRRAREPQAERQDDSMFY